MSTYAEIKDAVLGYLQLNVTTTDILPGAGDANAVKAEVEKMILRGVNNAVSRAEKLCDFRENEVEALVSVPSGGAADLGSVVDKLSGETVAMVKLTDAVYTTEVDGEVRTGALTLMDKQQYRRYKKERLRVTRTIGVVRGSRLELIPAFDEDVELQVEGFRRFSKLSEDALLLVGQPLTYNGTDLNGVWEVYGEENGKPAYELKVGKVLKGKILWSGGVWTIFDYYAGPNVPGTSVYSANEDVDTPDLVGAWTKSQVDEPDWAGTFSESGRCNWMTENAFEYLQWAAVAEVNHYLQVFVPSQEGALSPPDTLAERALAELIRDESFVTSGFNCHA